MDSQKGAALIVVLSLLTISLMVGLSSMQSSQIDERLAGNHKLATEVQMAAEKAATEGYSRIAEPDGVPGLLQYLLRGECSIEDLFLPGDRDDLSWDNVDTKIQGWDSLLTEDGEPCESYQDSWIAKRNDALDGADYPYPDFSELYGGLGDDTCSGSMQCIYRYMSYTDTDGVHRYIVGLAAYFNEDGDLIAESSPVFVDLDVDDPPSNIDWIFSASPIALLTNIANIGINGANNSTLDGGGHVDIMAHGDNAEELDNGFSVDTGNNQFDPEICTLPGTNDTHGDGVCGSASDEFATIENFMSVLQALIGASDESDFIAYHSGDLKMKDHPFDNVGNDSGKILVVDGDFVWNGKNDFEGTVIVLGSDLTYNGGGSGDLYGSLIHAPLKVDENGNYGWLDDAANFTFNGGGNSALRSDAEAQMEAGDALWGAIASAEYLTWESD